MRTILDTCVVSELRQRDAHPAVLTAVARIAQADLFVSVVTFGEIQKGISLLPQGRRRTEFETWFASLLDRYANQILDIDIETALIWGGLAARPAFRGRHTLSMDLLIAASALNHGMVVMTRNTKDFRETGVRIIDPWEGSGEG